MAQQKGCCSVSRTGPGGRLQIAAPGERLGGGVTGNLAETIARAFDGAVHGGDGGSSSGYGVRGAASGGAGGAEVIQFPMVNPYRPLLRTRAPIAGLNAFPSRVPRVRDITNFSYSLKQFNVRGDEDATLPEGSESMGFAPDMHTETFPSGIGLPQSGPSNLQTILNAINTGLATVPAILSARKKMPYYDPAGNIYAAGTANPNPGYALESGGVGVGSNIGAQAGAAVGNIGDTMGAIVQQHPLLVLGGGAALLLWFMQSPRRR